MAETIFQILEKRINDLNAGRKEAICGGAMDPGQYKFTCGVLEGLTLAQREIEDLKRRVEQQDDE